MTKSIGFLITHGTDTMAWGLSYLSYSLSNVGFNVALVGSQIPMDEVPNGSDAYLNLETAVTAVAEATPPRIMVAMNAGQRVFTDHVWKVDKWGIMAFQGRTVLSKESNQIVYDRAVGQRETPGLDVLFVLKTGGTIEQGFHDGLLRPDPGKDTVTRFLRASYGGPQGTHGLSIQDIRSYSLMALDSSDLTPPDWQRLASEIVNLARTEGYRPLAEGVDCNSVGVVFATPLNRAEDYDRMAAGKAGLVFVGYGGGNVNLRETGYSPIAFLRQHRQRGGWIVLTSHPERGILDPLYENGRTVFDERLALPSLDFSLSRCQVKLAYILTHQHLIQDLVKERKLGDDACDRLVALIFLSGGQFLRPATRAYFESSWGITIPDQDLLFDLPFANGLRLACRWLRPPRRSSFSFPEYLSGARSDATSRRAALIVKPDAIVGQGPSGVPIDAARAVRRLVEKAFEWDTVTLDLERGFDHVLDPASRVTDFNILFLEGGRQSVYDAASFLGLPPYASRDEMRTFYSRVVAGRARSQAAPPAIFICLSHQLLAQTLLESALGAITTPVPEALSAEWSALSQEIAAKAESVLGTSREAVRPNERPEHRLVDLRPYHPSPGLSGALADAHAASSARFAGLVEDVLNAERLDITMLHGDEVSETALLFVNWALVKIDRFRRGYADDLPDDSPLWALPAAVEITSSTCDPDSGEVLTEVASAAVHYHNREGYVYRDFSFQFHPELLVPNRIREPERSEEIDLSVANDGLKLLLAATLGAFSQYKAG